MGTGLRVPVGTGWLWYPWQRWSFRQAGGDWLVDCSIVLGPAMCPYDADEGRIFRATFRADDGSWVRQSAML
jgi:hypothetical protein